MAYWILLALYLLLVLLYAYHYRHPTIKAWPKVPKVSDIMEKPNTCQHTSECPPYHMCLQNICVPLLLRGEECNKETGDWTIISIQGQKFAACVCKDPNIVNQKHFGGNCDQDVACRPYGYYNLVTKKCVCQKGFRADGLKCTPLLAVEQLIRGPCEVEEVEYKDLGGGHGLTTQYIHKNADKKCFKRPCTFDAFTGKYLKKARYEQGIGCVCDPSYGQFGVRLEGLNSYIRGDGYNACVSVFETPLEKPIFVKVFAYFYLMQRPPIVFIQYSNLNPSDIIEPLRPLLKDNALQIAQEFPYDYLQAHLRKREPFVTSRRTIKIDKNLYSLYSYKVKTTTKTDTKQIPNAMEWCRFMSRHITTTKMYEWSFNLLNLFPMCYIGKDDTDSPEQFRGRYVLNPFQLTLTDPKQSLERTNGVVFTFEQGQWVLSLTDGHDVETYHTANYSSFIPDISDDPVAEMVEKPATGVVLIVNRRDPFDKVNKRYEETHDDRVANNEPIFDNK